MNQVEHNAMFYAAQNGDGDSFAKLFDAYWDMAYFNCLKRLNNRQDAEDAAQEVFIILHRRLAAIKGPEYLAKAIQFYTMEVCGGYVRKRKRIQSDQFVSYEELSERVAEEKEEFLPTAVLENKELKEEILQLVDNLPKKQRAVLFNYYFNDFSGKEISKMLGISQSAVGFNLHKARKKLAALASEHMDIEKPALMAGVPVLSHILREDMASVVTNGLKERIALGLQSKLAAGTFAVPVGKAVGTSVGISMGIGAKVAIGAAALTASAGIAVGVNNYINIVEKPPENRLFVASVSSVTTDMDNVNTEEEEIMFKRKWGFLDTKVCETDSGEKYSVSSNTINGQQYFVGHKKTTDDYNFIWERVDKSSSAPDGLDIISWADKLLLKSYYEVK